MYLQKYGHRLVDHGYKIVPIKPNKKAPMLSGWQDIVATKTDVDNWLANGHADGGVGVLCKETCAVDIDCLDAKVNYDLLHWIEENVGKSLIRIGQKPKCILPFRVEGSFSKIRSAVFEDSTGAKHAVEILANGQQFVAFGIHPATKAPYQWVRGRSIADVKQSDLPVLSRDQAQAFVAYFESLADKNAAWSRISETRIGSDVSDDDYLMTLVPTIDMSVDEVKEMVDSLDPDMDHDEWVRVGMALHHHFAGEDAGWLMWDDWSMAGSKHKDGECERRYATFDSAGRIPITLASVKAMNRVVESDKVVEERLPKMLRQWAFVHVEGSARVVREDLKKEHMNCRVLSDGERPKLLNLVDIWLEHQDRRTFAAGLTFAPDLQTLDRYNLWRGWSFDAIEGDVEPWLDFVTNVIADGNAVYANYIIAWAAQIIQRPMSKIGVGLVLRGGKGTGKTKFGELLGHLFEAHHQIVSRSHHVTGNFNRHLEACLLLQADEAYWAGAKSSEGSLKDLLTNPKMQIERKGVDAYSAPNFTRVLFTSNEDYVVPASLDERRFAVFDVGVTRQQDSLYFSKLDKWYESGGASALMHYLRQFDLSKMNLRLVPQTDALQDQKIEYLDNIASWLFNCLQNGEIREHRVAGNVVNFGDEVSKAEIYDIYCTSLRSKWETPRKENVFWRDLSKFGDIVKAGRYKRVEGETRQRYMRINTLDACRFMFEASTKMKIDWPVLDADQIDADPFDPDNWGD